MVYVNGLPLFVIELKNPADEQADIFQAYRQLQTYKEEIEELFVTNEALIISDGVSARIGSLTADTERFMRWRTVRDEKDRPLLEYELETLIRGFFDPVMLTDYLRFLSFSKTTANGLSKRSRAIISFTPCASPELRF